jgi:hypothetical protein
MSRDVVKHDPVAGDVGKEGPAAGQLVVDVMQGVNNKIDRRLKVSGNRQLPYETLGGDFPAVALSAVLLLTTTSRS